MAGISDPSTLSAAIAPVIAAAAPALSGTQPQHANAVSRNEALRADDDRARSAAVTPATGATVRFGDIKTLIAAQESQLTRDRRQGELSEEEQKVVQELKQRDAEVRRHERAHAAAAGPYAGAATFEYVRGPDGNLYAVDGEVKIDAAPENDPAATIAKMEIIIRAALAPADPSAQDRAVASQAKQDLTKAKAELAEKKAEEERQTSERRDDPSGATEEGQDAAQNAADIVRAVTAFDAAGALLGLGSARPDQGAAGIRV